MIRVLVTTAAAGAACGLGFNSMAPRSQLFGRTFTRDGANSRQIALTYDDGPNDRHTLDLLEVLDEHKVKATFFMIGRYAVLWPQIADTVARAGHVIGNHTFTHPNLIFCSRARVRAEVRECARALTDAVGEHSSLFRPPFGGRRPDVLRLVREMGLEPVMWSVTAHDWHGEAVSRIETRVARQLRGGDVILLHDGSHLGGADRSNTVAATGQLIRRYRDQGFTFVTVSEMIRSALQPSPTDRRE